MSNPALEVADIFRAHGPAWRKLQAGHLSLGQLKVPAVLYCFGLLHLQICHELPLRYRFVRHLPTAAIL